MSARVLKLVHVFRIVIVFSCVPIVGVRVSLLSCVPTCAVLVVHVFHVCVNEYVLVLWGLEPRGLWSIHDRRTIA